MTKILHTPLLGNNKRIATLLSLNVFIITLTIWLQTSFSGFYADISSIILTLLLSISAMLIGIIKLEWLRWPVVWASVGALLGTRLTIATHSILLDGYSTAFGILDTDSYQSLPGFEYAILGTCFGLTLFALSNIALNVWQSWEGKNKA